MEYLNKLRLRQAAKILMEDKKKQVLDVAFMCGFSSNQYFNFAFKKHYKVTPNQYRKAKKKELI
jgi:AraC family L-rhamnose operon regulatory protein RhaS